MFTQSQIYYYATTYKNVVPPGIIHTNVIN